MIPAQIVLVASPGGARGDFVAGWLGTLPNFIDNYWSINPLTGKSRGTMDGAKSLDRGASLIDVIHGQHITPTADIDLYWAGSCHGTNLKNFVQDIKSLPVKVLPISIKGVDEALIRWEFVIKTYSEPKKTFGMYMNRETPSIDQLVQDFPVTDLARASALIPALSSTAHISSVEEYLPSELLGNLINYNDLFRPGGSRILCKVLGIDSATEKNHEFWDLMLPVASTPTTIVSWGQTFSINR